MKPLVWIGEQLPAPVLSLYGAPSSKSSLKPSSEPSLELSSHNETEALIHLKPKDLAAGSPSSGSAISSLSGMHSRNSLICIHLDDCIGWQEIAARLCADSISLTAVSGNRAAAAALLFRALGGGAVISIAELPGMIQTHQDSEPIVSPEATLAPESKFVSNVGSKAVFSGVSARGGDGPGKSGAPLVRWHLYRRLQLLTVFSRLKAGRADDFPRHVADILEGLMQVSGAHICILLIFDSEIIKSLSRVGSGVYREDYRDFMNFCLSDFFSYFPRVNLDNVEEDILNRREDFENLNMSRQKISSYLCLPVRNSQNVVTATLHLGHHQNEYFSGPAGAVIREYLSAVESMICDDLEARRMRRRSGRIMDIFSRFVPREIIPELVQRQKQMDRDTVERSAVSVLFSDIRSFTTITEGNSAQLVVEFLNRHFTVMVAIIREEGGVIDKFIGDAIVAVFSPPDGATRGDSFESNSAVRAAIRMSKAVGLVDCSGLVMPEGGYSIGIGVHSGEAIVGNIGSADKMEYTAIGDVVGIAEELEAMTKRYPGLVLVSGEAAAGYHGDPELVMVDRVELGGAERSLWVPGSVLE